VHIALQFDGAGSLTNRYLHGPAWDMGLADEYFSGGVSQGNRWALTDHLGTVRDLVDNSGAVVKHLKYDSWGNIRSDSAPAVNELFADSGRPLDKEIDAYDNRGREDDPRAGRFFSEDRTGLSGGDTNQSRDRGNNPISRKDPDGNKWYDWVPGLNQFAWSHEWFRLGTVSMESAELDRKLQQAKDKAYMKKHGVDPNNAVLRSIAKAKGLESPGSLIDYNSPESRKHFDCPAPVGPVDLQAEVRARNAEVAVQPSVALSNVPVAGALASMGYHLRRGEREEAGKSLGRALQDVAFLVASAKPMMASLRNFVSSLSKFASAQPSLIKSGENVARVSIAGDVAVVEIEYVQTLTDRTFFCAITKAARDRGATSMLVRTGAVHDIDLAIKLGVASEQGRTIAGGRIISVYPAGTSQPSFDIWWHTIPRVTE
jgi:RHS repeat-associated protein